MKNEICSYPRISHWDGDGGISTAAVATATGDKASYKSKFKLRISFVGEGIKEKIISDNQSGRCTVYGRYSKEWWARKPLVQDMDIDNLDQSIDIPKYIKYLSCCTNNLLEKNCIFAYHFRSASPSFQVCVLDQAVHNIATREKTRDTEKDKERCSSQWPAPSN